MPAAPHLPCTFNICCSASGSLTLPKIGHRRFLEFRPSLLYPDLVESFPYPCPFSYLATIFCRSKLKPNQGAMANKLLGYHIHSMYSVHPGRQLSLCTVSRETKSLKLAKLRGCTFVNQYVVIKYLGRGACGRVFLCMDMNDNRLYAVKVGNLC